MRYQGKRGVASATRKQGLLARCLEADNHLSRDAALVLDLDALELGPGADVPRARPALILYLVYERDPAHPDRVVSECPRDGSVITRGSLMRYLLDVILVCRIWRGGTRPFLLSLLSLGTVSWSCRHCGPRAARAQ